MSEHVHSKECERAVLGAVLAASDSESQRIWSVVHDIIQTPLAFFVRDHQLLSLVMDELWMRGKPCDIMTVYDGLRQVSFQSAMDGLAKLRGRKPVVDFSAEIPGEDSVAMAIGGANALGDMMSTMGRSTERAIKANASVVAEHYRQREAIRMAGFAIAKLQSPSGRTDLRLIADGLADGLIRMMGGRSGTRSIADAFESVMAQHEEAKTSATRPLPVWPLEKLQKLCRFRDGSFVVLAATSGGGKTSLALQAATATAESINKDGCVGIVSREMTSDDLTRIIVARKSGFSVEALERGELTEAQLEQARVDICTVAKSVVVCDSLEKLSHKEICAWARSQHTRTNGGLRLLIVDHLGLLDGENPRQTDYEKITAATRALKVLAIELKIVVLALCQLNKDGQRRQQQSMEERYGAEDFTQLDLKGSGSIAHDADQIVFICKQSADSNGSMAVKIKVDKNRWGARGEFPAVFMKANGQRFIERDEVTKHHGIPDTEPRDSEDLFN
jgi:replicative DNA helicase